MSPFLDDLHFFCTEHLAPPEDASYRAGMDTLCGMEAQIERALGKDFFRRYDELSYQMRQWEALESFRAGIDGALGEGACHVLSIRPQGGVEMEVEA